MRLIGGFAPRPGTGLRCRRFDDLRLVRVAAGSCWGVGCGRCAADLPCRRTHAGDAQGRATAGTLKAALAGRTDLRSDDQFTTGVKGDPLAFGRRRGMAEAVMTNGLESGGQHVTEIARDELLSW